MIDVIVIGGGVAGLTAALNCRRNGKSVLIIEKEVIGGQITNSPRVENFPTILSISGNELAEKLFAQVTDQGAAFEMDDITAVAKIDGGFSLTGEYAVYSARSIIIATGARHRHTGVEGEDELVGKGVYYCALCDGAFYKGEPVALIGDGNTAMQYALLLSDYCSKVTLYTMFDKFFGDGANIKAVLSKKNIEWVKNCVVCGFRGASEGLSGLSFKRKDGGVFEDNTSRALFVAIGQVPCNKIFEQLVDIDREGYIACDENCVTKTEGVFVAGDCRAKKIRQLSTAVADGAVAGTAASSYLNMLDALNE